MGELEIQVDIVKKWSIVISNFGKVQRSGKAERKTHQSSIDIKKEKTERRANSIKVRLKSLN